MTLLMFDIYFRFVNTKGKYSWAGKKKLKNKLEKCFRVIYANIIFDTNSQNY